MCSNLKVLKYNNPFIAQTNFTGIQWIMPTLSSTFSLQFSSVLPTSTAAIGPIIEVLSSPTNLEVKFNINY